MEDVSDFKGSAPGIFNGNTNDGGVIAIGKRLAIKYGKVN
jgi:hypothetical protein